MDKEMSDSIERVLGRLETGLASHIINAEIRHKETIEAIDEVADTGKSTLQQATKTNGRVLRLEGIVDGEHGLENKVEKLVKFQDEYIGGLKIVRAVYILIALGGTYFFYLAIKEAVRKELEPLKEEIRQNVHAVEENNMKVKAIQDFFSSYEITSEE